MKIIFTTLSLLICLKITAWVAPTLVSPSDGASVWTGVTLDWNAVGSSQFYQLQVDTSVSFNSPVILNFVKPYINSSSGNSDTQHFIDALYFGKTYYWRVRAYIAGDTSSWNMRYFSTRDYITLSSPSNGSTTWTGLTLDWLPHTGVDFYDMECDTSLTFASPALRIATKTYINSSDGNSDTYHFLDDLFFGKTYHWRVRARNASDTSSWSSIWTFTTRDYITLSSPSNGSTTWTGLTLDWLPHTGVDFYDMECDSSLTFASPVLRTATKTYINSSDGNSDTYHFLDDLFFGKSYYWRVRARNASDTSSWSATWSYNTRDYVNLASPSNGQLNVNVSGVTLDWAPHTGIDIYQLQWDTVNIFNSPFLTTMNKNYINSSDGNSDTYQATGALTANKVYFWRVRAINAVDSSEWSGRWFSTGSTPAQIPNTPVLVSPADMSQNQPTSLTLEWNTSVYATSYEYVINTFPDFTGITPIAVNDTFGGISGLVIDETYFWQVRAVNGTNIYSGWSATWSFATGCLLSVPVVNGAGDFCTDSPVTLTAQGAVDYNWYGDSTGTNLIGTGNQYVVTGPGFYEFWVSATDGVCESNMTYVTINIFPEPLTPGITQNGDTLFSSAATAYQWYIEGTPITGADSQNYIPAVSGNYSVQITDNNGCTSLSALYYFDYLFVMHQTVSTFAVYPNPVKDYIGIYSDCSTRLEIIIRDVAGVIISVASTSGNKYFQYPADCIQQGIYFVTVKCGSGAATIPIIKL